MRRIRLLIRQPISWVVLTAGAVAAAVALACSNRGSTRYRSVSTWCARFHVSFGAAELTKT